jgi:hypothetical protein
MSVGAGCAAVGLRLSEELGLGVEMCPGQQLFGEERLAGSSVRPCVRAHR